MDDTSQTELTRALRLLQAGKPDAASAVLARLLKRNPNDELAWYALSRTLSDRGRQVYALERVLQINPENETARARLSDVRGADATADRRLSQQAAATVGVAEERSLAARSDSEQPLQSLLTLTMGPQPATPFGRMRRLRIRARLSWRRFKDDWRVFAGSRLGVLGVVIIVLFGLLAVAHPILMKTVWPRGVYDPVTGFDMQVFPHPSMPGTGHILGTDVLGRDVLSMLLAATTPTFLIGLTAAVTTAVIGTLLSATAAYFRGAVDATITNVSDVFLLFPAPVIMVIIGARFRDLGPVHLGLIYGFVTGTGATTIVMRTRALQVVSKPFMEAARVAGGGAFHIITKHLMPAILPLAALQMMIAAAGAVVADGFISFFGLTRTSSNWGTIIYDAFVYANVSGAPTGMWHMLLPAAICFSLFALGFYLVSRGLHRVAAPTIREQWRK